MINLIIASSKEAEMLIWLAVLQPIYPLIFCDNIENILSGKTYTKARSLLVMDISLLTEMNQILQLRQYVEKVIVVGHNLTTPQKIECILKGAVGYCEKSISSQQIVRVIKGIENNEVWLERQLIPYILQEITFRNNAKEIESEFDKVLETLTQRETEVVKLIYNGENNISISQSLDISIRTVKAHLTAIYAKLNVSDRFHLIVFLKNLEISHISNNSSFLDNSLAMKIALK